jgi:hypothetical protein
MTNPYRYAERSFCWGNSASNALLAHSVEHFHGKEEVVGSIPTEGSVI